MKVSDELLVDGHRGGRIVELATVVRIQDYRQPVRRTTTPIKDTMGGQWRRAALSLRDDSVWGERRRDRAKQSIFPDASIRNIRLIFSDSRKQDDLKKSSR